MTERRHTPQAGPPLVGPAGAYAALTVAAVALFGDGPRPTTNAVVTLEFIRMHTDRMHVLAFVVFGAAVPLAVWSATAYRRLRRLGVTAPGGAIALVGGTLAAGSLALSALMNWVAANAAPELSPGLARVLVDLSFATGAAGMVVPEALLVAGVAVPALLLRLVPAWLAWVGLVVAAAGVLSSLTLLTDALDPLLPIARFGSLVWVLVISVRLPTRRATASPSTVGTKAGIAT